ncbi:TetR/AcrR family transcriptional regulator [Actinoplanes sp. N902-109]|uniref:TetR/AcrR family transcriptional regulator n=1 Tax=Actinoplanes sp. (strain N902-109) TaxID=649831 RepID=UPI000329549F|nr:TetR/AcrR family transcriptional regulator [Actinoplanes sp. N902-109]AGL17884.1 TetR family transcriptional regulator [Actinoplanes sp. N902-109]
MPPRSRRSAADTRAEIRRVALDLFTEKGFDATSTRDIAAALGMNQSSLYYHFAGKDDIVRSLMQTRQHDAEEFLTWLLAQPVAPGLLRTAALRWLDATTEEHVHGQRLALANPAVQRRLSGNSHAMAGTFDRVVAVFTGPEPAMADLLLVRTVFNAVGSVLTAAPDTKAEPADIIAAARRMVLALTRDGGPLP